MIYSRGKTKILDENAFGIWSKIMDHIFKITFNAVGEEEHRRKISEGFRNVNAGIYIHFPFCRSFCLYCPYYREIWDENKFSKYRNALIKEIQIIGNILENSDVKIVDIHIGGGTPSIPNPSFWKDIMEELKENFNINVNLGIEANPEDLADEEKTVKLLDSEVTELSIGVQSFHRTHLKALGRRHSVEDVEKTLKNIEEVGFKHVNMDLMYMIPNIPYEKQLDNWREDLERAVQYKVQQITIYPTLITRQCPARNLIKNGRVTQPVQFLDQFLIEARRILEREGYKRIRIYSWSRGGEYATVNLEMIGPLLALGPGAMGFTGSYEWINVHSIDEYVKRLSKGELPVSVSRKVNLGERIARYVIDQLFTSGEVKIEEFQRIFGGGLELIPKGLNRSLSLMKLLKFIKFENNCLKLTEKGFKKANRLIWAFVLKVPCRLVEKLTIEHYPEKVEI